MTKRTSSWHYNKIIHFLCERHDRREVRICRDNWKSERKGTNGRIKRDYAGKIGISTWRNILIINYGQSTKKKAVEFYYTHILGSAEVHQATVSFSKDRK